MNADRAERVVLTAEEREAMVCDCLRCEDDTEPHGDMCATRGEYDILLDPATVVERAETLIAAHVAACDTAWRDRIEALLTSLASDLETAAMSFGVGTYSATAKLRALAAESQEER